MRIWRFSEWDESARKTELQVREESLWKKKHGKTWRTELPSPLKVGKFHRGFPYAPQQSANGEQFLAFPQVKLNAARFGRSTWVRFPIAMLQSFRIPQHSSPQNGKSHGLAQGRSVHRECGGARVAASPNARNLKTLGLIRQGYAMRECSACGSRESPEPRNALSGRHRNHRCGIATPQRLARCGAVARTHARRERTCRRVAGSDCHRLLGHRLKSLMIGGNPRHHDRRAQFGSSIPAAGHLEFLNVCNSMAVTPSSRKCWRHRRTQSRCDN